MLSLFLEFWSKLDKQTLEIFMEAVWQYSQILSDCRSMNTTIIDQHWLDLQIYKFWKILRYNKPWKVFQIQMQMIIDKH